MGSIASSVIVMLFALIFIGRLEFCFCGSNNSNVIGCIKSECEGLLKFKKNLLDRRNQLSTWVGEDCCTWKGVGCSKTTGHVVKLDLHNPNVHFYDSYSYVGEWLAGDLSPSLLSLKHLRYMDMSGNDFSKIPIPSFLGSFKSLRYLNLSNSGFIGKVPHHLGNLSSLQYLDLHDSISESLSVDSLQWASRLSSLKQLDLSYADLSEATDWLYTINMLPSLLVLKLASCRLHQFPSPSHINTTSLVSLDLSDNSFPSFISGSILYTLGRLTSLRVLSLSKNYLESSLSNSLCNLISLVYLDLSINQINGSIPLCVANMTSLSVLNLKGNNFQGSIPSSIGNLTKLTVLDLWGTQVSGSIPTSIGSLRYLRRLDVSQNQLNGSIPSSFGNLSSLEYLDVSFNSLGGTITETHFAKLTSLTELRASYNSLVWSWSPRWVPPFQLQVIKMASCKLGTPFPQWLRTQSSVVKLDISNASISDTMPDWFEKLYSRIRYLNLAGNQIGGNVPKFEDAYTNEDSMEIDEHRELILRSNKFEGPLVPFPSDVGVLDFSNNLFSGEIPTSVCKMKNLDVLDLSKNQLSGTLPWCIGDLQDLEALDVTSNDLHGDIPSSLGTLRSLTFLHLSNNRFQGTLPSSLMNLTNLETLDVGGNSLTGIIPPWIGEKLTALKYLVLQSNKFYGDIPPQLCYLSLLQVLDMARNDITGNIPRCFSNLTSMATDENSFLTGPNEYKDNLVVSFKGIELEYTSTLPFVISIDLSNNNIVGGIPEELMNLSILVNLNVSGNYLEGRIPEKIGSLKQLQSLDLSRNQLSGAIPLSLSNINFLSHLNLSFNNLSGRIPTGNQLQTLNDPSTYIGNDGLCGKPLLKSCPGDEPREVDHRHGGDNKAEDGDDDQSLWFYAGMGPGALVGFLGVCGTLHFKKSWRYAYFQLVESICNWIMLAVALKVAWLQRMFHKAKNGR